MIEQPTEPVVIEETETPPPPTEAPVDNNPPDTGSEEPQETPPPPTNNNEPRVTRLILVNADTNQDIMQLTDGMSISLNNLPTQNLNIRADVAGTVESVKFKGTDQQLESAAPFTLFGDENGQYFGQTPSTGNFVIKVTPYTEKSGKGTAGSTMTITIQFTN